MKNSNSTIRNSATHRRRANKSRRKQWVIGLLIVILIAGCCSFMFRENSASNKNVATVSTTRDTSKPSLPKNIQLAWPAVGEAAIGSVDDGLLTQSSANETSRPTASIAKIIAALAVMEKQPFAQGQQGQTYTVNGADIDNLNTYIAEDGSVLPLRIGTKITQYEAMQRMLIASDNNMADMLTERVFGSKAAYVAYANKMLKRMGLSQSNVADASGFDSSTVSTPSEMVKIGIAAFNNPVISEIVSQQQADLPGIGIITNTNELLGTDGVIGMKTGTTDEAGSCLLFAARYETQDRQEKVIVGVIMGDTDHPSLYSDVATLLASTRQSFGLTIPQSDETNTTDTMSQPGMRGQRLEQ
jgi:serine-type D-Ala-D-Ala carboxypeptidase (penicillin-binding protein 5/6)